MLKQRVITALVLLPIVLWSVFGGVYGAFPVFAALLVLIAAYEWTNLMQLRSFAQRFGYLALVAMGIAYFQRQDFSSQTGLLMVAASFAWLFALGWVMRYPEQTAQWAGRGRMALIGLMLLLPTWAGLVALHAQSPWWLMYVLLLVWGADTGAYFSGRRFGRVKLAVHVSPAKTREGLYGGLLLTSLIIAGVTIYLSLDMARAMLFMSISLLTVLASVLGDLFESMAKRRAGIKDSGRIFPGHGGALDRIDSLTAAAPVFMAGWWLAGGF
ncbi:phosphatidate cytidylyltransferase [Paraperlucidibaca baekdonensis]|uniref:Phosphatidate cytidylyltransferase n=1 Tax=Paraperlucidibaca baekdonensis TaxID=748120 RepID=A0A3E0H5W0_9GAMM|nr:phosphatidate cytidylyltransferase [Paraperlucidibaca baekdonensis]REH37892.1 phosphatidate cytidylyltransferase [Paraperlucidibaca baekdonensis]